jgi:hypothetical protein
MSGSTNCALRATEDYDPRPSPARGPGNVARASTAIKLAKPVRYRDGVSSASPAGEHLATPCDHVIVGAVTRCHPRGIY